MRDLWSFSFSCCCCGVRFIADFTYEVKGRKNPMATGSRKSKMVKMADGPIAQQAQLLSDV